MAEVFDATDSELSEVALKTAGLSPCVKRKVGAVVFDTKTGRYYTGHNFNTVPHQSCEDCNGNTVSTVMHAEVSAISKAMAEGGYETLNDCIMYVTHQPCNNCMAKIDAAGIKTVHIVNAFMKFDAEKQTFSLLPKSAVTVVRQLNSLTSLALEFRTAEPSPFEYPLAYEKLINSLAGGRTTSVVLAAVQKVLEYGAKKYKPNNWRTVDSVDRYWDALIRHCSALETGEVLDSESGLPHADHALCNIVFLTELTQ